MSHHVPGQEELNSAYQLLLLCELLSQGKIFHYIVWKITFESFLRGNKKCRNPIFSLFLTLNLLTLMANLDDVKIANSKFPRIFFSIRIKFSAVDSTAEIQGRRLCRECKDEKHPKSSAKFQETDATFKCPAKSCGADKLSYREFYVGSCCDGALDRDVREGKLNDSPLL